MSQVNHQKKRNLMALLLENWVKNDFDWGSTGLLSGLDKCSHKHITSLFDWIMENNQTNYRLLLPIVRRVFSKLKDEIEQRLKSEPIYLESKYDFIIMHGSTSLIASKMVYYLIDLKKLIKDFNKTVSTIKYLRDSFPNLDSELAFCQIFSENQSLPILNKLKFGLKDLIVEVNRIEKIDQITNGLE